MDLQEGPVQDLKPEDEEDGTEAEDSFWLQIMAECEANSPNKLPSSKSILILGDNDAQKAQLVAKLQASGEKQRKGNGLEYYFLNVRDEYCENQTKLNVWVLDDDPSFQGLLKYVVNENTISDVTIVLMAAMTKPWEVFRSICTWVGILQSHINSLNIPSDVLNEQKSKVLRRYQDYVEPTMSIYGNLDEQSNSTEIETNLGLEIIVVITQTEYMTMLQSEFGYIDEHFDFIQFSLRKFCLTYGAALFYVSVKEDRNCDILLKYILHKIYSFPFRIPAMFLEKDSIFVPAGWDSENKILALAESLATIAFSSPFEDVIVKPGRLADDHRVSAEVVAQNDQDFLLALQAALLRQPIENNSDANRDNSISTTITSRNPPRRVSRSPQKKQLEAKLASGEGDTVLQSFFKSLLKRQTSAPAERPTGLSGNRMHNYNSSGNSSGFDRSTSLENPANEYSKGNLGSRSLGTSVDSSVQSKECESLSAVDELNTSGDFNSRIKKELDKKIEETELDPFTVFLRKYKTQGDGPNTAAQLSLDDEDDVHQLPEYFMSSQSSNHCPADCCYPNNATNSNGNNDLDMDLTLDRVKSKFNPPLRLLLENSNDSSKKNVPEPSANNGLECTSNDKSSAGTGQLNGASGCKSSMKKKASEEPSNVEMVVDPLFLEKSAQKTNGVEDI